MTTSYLARALDAIPGRATLAAALTDVDERIARLHADEQDRARPSADAADHLAAGQPIDLDDVIDQVAAIDEDNARRATARGVLAHVRERLAHRLETLDREHVDTALADLDAALRHLVDEARDLLTDLGDQVTDVDIAIDRGVAVQWRHAHQIAEEIDQLRAAQVDLVTHRFDQSRGPAVPDAAVRLWGSITDPGRHRSPEDLTAAWRAARARGERPDLPWAGATLDALRYLCRDDVEPVVPPIDVLRRVRVEVTERTEQTPRRSMIEESEELRPRTTRVLPYASDVRQRREHLRAQAADAELEQRHHTASSTSSSTDRQMVEDATPMLTTPGRR